MNDLKIDPEFRDLIPPLTDEEFKGLEKNLLSYGVRVPLVVWQGTLIDGHNRYKIAKRHNLPFKTEEMQFADRDAAIVWIVDNQLDRRNLTPALRIKLALVKEPIIAKQAKERQLSTLKQNTETVQDICPEREETPIEQPTAKRDNQIERQNTTNYQVAQIAQVSDKTVQRYKKIQEKASEEIKAKVDSGEISINAAYEGVKAGATTVEEIKEKKPHVSFNSGNNEWYTPANIIESARKVLGIISLDPASSEIANETVKAEKFFTAEDDGLVHDWEGNIWLNPPYSSGLIEKFVDKLLSSNFQQAIVLVNNATDTEWFSRLANKAAAIVFPKGRVKFYKPDGTIGAPLQGQAVLYFGNSIENFKANFEQYGRCWQ